MPLHIVRFALRRSQHAIMCHHQARAARSLQRQAMLRTQQLPTSKASASMRSH